MSKSINWTRSRAGRTESRCGRFAINRSGDSYSLSLLVRRESFFGLATQAAAKAQAERIVDADRNRRIRANEAAVTKAFAEARERRNR